MNDGPLDALAARLVVPAKSGVCLAKSELIALARLSEGSLRVNERRRMLADVLKSPQNPDELSALLERLIHFCRASLADWDDALGAWPDSARFAQPWQQKTRATIEHLEGLREELAATPR